MPRNQSEGEDVKGYIHATESFGAVDGPGIRYVFFLQGCPLRCIFCHNPTAIPLSGGAEWTAGQARDEVLKYKNFIKNGGVTLTGGEPLLQSRFCTALLSLLKEEGIHTAIDTSGSERLPKIKEAIDLADLILLDIKSIDTAVSKEISGRGNENSLALLNYCEETRKPVWIRQVILKGYTMVEKDLAYLADFLKGYSCVERVELLPFHKLGEHKWDNYERAYILKDTPETTKEELIPIIKIFTDRGLIVQ